MAGTKSLVSVIVPIYNVERFLDHCMETLTKQSYQELEIILVDDGSPDSCPAMVDRWASVDERIKAIHQPNGGPSSARNTGLREAHGEYVLFVDPDDWMELHMIETMLDFASEHQADIVNCQFVEEKSHQTSTQRPSLYPPFIKGGREGTILLCEDKSVTSHVWRNLFRRELLPLDFFPINVTYEDLAILHEIFFKSDKIVFIGDVLYHYFINENGIVGTKTKKNICNYISALERRLKFVQDNIPEYFLQYSRVYARDIYTIWRNACKDYKRFSSSDSLAIIEITEKMLLSIPLRDIVFKKRIRVALLKLKYLLYLYKD